MKKARIVYASVFCALLLVEIGIGLYVHDAFVRPYVGDVLVTILLCSLCRTVIPKGVKALPLYVFAFATFVEVTQYFGLVTLLGWENNQLLASIIGTTFSFLDLVCYGVGCLTFWLAEKATLSFLKHRHNGS